VLIAFFYYKGGLRLVSILVVTFLFLVALFHLIVVPSSRLFRRYSRYRDRAKQPEIPSTSEPVSAAEPDRSPRPTDPGTPGG
jgi:hypothetical protein